MHRKVPAWFGGGERGKGISTRKIPRRAPYPVHRGREPHQRPGPAVRVPAPGPPGGLGLADRHPDDPRQRRRRAPQRSRAGPRPAPGRRRPGDRGRGILHRRRPPHDPLDGIHPGHGHVVAGSDRRRSRGRRPRRPAHPERPRTAAALQTRAESTPEIPDTTAPRPPSPGNPRSPYSRPATASPVRDREPSGRRKAAPLTRGRGPWNRAPPRRDTRVPGMPSHHPEKDFRARTEHKHIKHPRKPETPKVRGVGMNTGRRWHWSLLPLLCLPELASATAFLLANPVVTWPRRQGRRSRPGATKVGTRGRHATSFQGLRAGCTAILPAAVRCRAQAISRQGQASRYPAPRRVVIRSVPSLPRR